MLLTSIAGAAAAAVTRGDLMVTTSPDFEKEQDVCRAKFYSPKGKLKAVLRFKGYNTVFARAVSQDGRYAAVGLYLLTEGGYRALGPPKEPLKVVFLQLSGASPKVLGTRTLPYIHNLTWRRGKHCHFDGGNSLALRSRSLSARAGAVLDVYLSIRCVPATDVPDVCARDNLRGGTSSIQHWSVTYKKATKLGPLATGKRAAFPEKVKCGAAGMALTVTASGKAYAAFAFRAANKLGFVDTIGVYEVRHSRSGEMRLVATWKLKIGNLNIENFRLTGPGTGCGVAETPRGVSKVYSFAKGRTMPYVGGRASGAVVNYMRFYQDISCTVSHVYALLATEGPSTPESVLKLSTKGLRKGVIGHVAFKTTYQAIPNILIIP
jgi:hypothetical protein